MALPIRGGQPYREALPPLLVERRATFAGYGTRVIEVVGDGVPFLFLHGYGDSADTWRSALELLAMQRHPAVAVDLPGFGEADRLRKEAVLPQLDRFALAALRQVARKSGRPVIVAGNSLGGCVALRLAERKSDQLAGVVPVAPAGLDMGRWLNIIEGEYLLRVLLASRAPIPHAVVQGAIRRLYRLLAFADSSTATFEVVSRFADHYSDMKTVRRYLSVGRTMMRELRDPYQLEKIACPVMVVWGTRDRMVYSSGADRIKLALPATRVELIEGCGHCPQIETRDRFVDLLSDFHADVSGAKKAN
jgi:pimeloyl-ACP methyl ester carboxylesterase